MVSAVEALRTAKQVLEEMRHSIYFIEEVVPAVEDGEQVWIVRALTSLGRLEVVIRVSDGVVLKVRSSRSSRV